MGKKVEKKPKQDTHHAASCEVEPLHTPSAHGDLPVTAILGTLSETTNTLQEQGSGWGILTCQPLLSKEKIGFFSLVNLPKPLSQGLPNPPQNRNKKVTITRWPVNVNVLNPSPLWKKLQTQLRFLPQPFYPLLYENIKHPGSSCFIPKQTNRGWLLVPDHKTYACLFSSYLCIFFPITKAVFHNFCKWNKMKALPHLCSFLLFPPKRNFFSPKLAAAYFLTAESRGRTTQYVLFASWAGTHPGQGQPCNQLPASLRGSFTKPVLSQKDCSLQEGSTRLTSIPWLLRFE